MHTYLFNAGNFSINQRMDCRDTDKGFVITPSSWGTKNTIVTLLSNEEVYEILADALAYLRDRINEAEYGLNDDIISDTKKYVANLFNQKILQY